MLNCWKTVPIGALGWIAAQAIMKVVAKLLQFNVEGMAASSFKDYKNEASEKSVFFRHSSVWPAS